MNTGDMDIPPHKRFIAEEKYKCTEEYQADRLAAYTIIYESRQKGLKISEIFPQSSGPTAVIDFCADEIRSGERFLITLPKSYTYLNGSTKLDCEVISALSVVFQQPEIGTDMIISALPDDVFLAIRPNGDMIMCDMYRV